MFGIEVLRTNGPQYGPERRRRQPRLYDGSELGKALATHPDDPEADLTECEQPLFPRSAAAAAGAELNEVLAP
ncbi:hypothetical protein [Streptomyces sp. Agncl-13]|uniref:hypothetical protein n=1 Tax=Streptomyces sp. Agncl-13 TaxID=3400628 RepID=UPI003A851CAC